MWWKDEKEESKDKRKKKQSEEKPAKKAKTESAEEEGEAACMLGPLFRFTGSALTWKSGRSQGGDLWWKRALGKFMKNCHGHGKWNCLQMFLKMLTSCVLFPCLWKDKNYQCFVLRNCWQTGVGGGGGGGGVGGRVNSGKMKTQPCLVIICCLGSIMYQTWKYQITSWVFVQWIKLVSWIWNNFTKIVLCVTCYLWVAKAFYWNSFKSYRHLRVLCVCYLEAPKVLFVKGLGDGVEDKHIIKFFKKGGIDVTDMRLNSNNE